MAHGIIVCKELASFLCIPSGTSYEPPSDELRIFPYVIFLVLCQILTPSWLTKQTVPYFSFALTLSWKRHIVSMQGAASLLRLCGTHGMDACNSLFCLFWWACSSFPVFCCYT